MAYEWITDGLDQTWQSIDRLLTPLSPEEFEAATPCPGWTVRDVLSHLVGFELMMQGVPAPEADSPIPAYVHNAIGDLNERFVSARRSVPGSEVLAEFRAVARNSLARLRSLSDEEWDVIGWSPEGDAPFHRFQETRILDSWIHLQDLRDALLQPEDDHGTGEEIVVNRFEGALPYIIGRRVRPVEGTTVRFNLSGRLARTILIEMVDGRARAARSLHGDPTVEITTPVALFWRRAAGRISGDSFLNASATRVSGDRALAREIAREMAVMI